MKYLLMIAIPSMAFCFGLEEVKIFALNQRDINEVYYYESEDSKTDSFFKGKMQAYEEVIQFIHIHSYID